VQDESRGVYHGVFFDGFIYHQYRRVAMCLLKAARGTRLMEYGSHSLDNKLYSTILSGPCLVDIYITKIDLCHHSLFSTSWSSTIIFTW
jgi:hypothetical protein